MAKTPLYPHVPASGVRVDVGANLVTLYASAAITSEWARRPGAAWPNSKLAGHRVKAEFQHGDLVDVTVDGRGMDIPSDEFNAFSSDILKDRLPKDHPDHWALVERFQPSSVSQLKEGEVEREYELKLRDGRRVTWTGRSGENAGRRYVDAHREAVVVAFREYPQHGLFVLPSKWNIVE